MGDHSSNEVDENINQNLNHNRKNEHNEPRKKEKNEMKLFKSSDSLYEKEHVGEIDSLNKSHDVNLKKKKVRVEDDLEGNMSHKNKTRSGSIVIDGKKKRKKNSLEEENGEVVNHRNGEKKRKKNVLEDGDGDVRNGNGELVKRKKNRNRDTEGENQEKMDQWNETEDTMVKRKKMRNNQGYKKEEKNVRMRSGSVVYESKKKRKKISWRMRMWMF